MSLRIKKGDTVKIIAGDSVDKGKTGKVIAVDPETGHVKVEGINMISRHRKARSAQEQSSIVKIEGNIDISNVMLVCPSCGSTTRIASVNVNGKNHRQCKKCGFDIDSKKADSKKSDKKAAKTEKAAKTDKTSRVKRTRKSDADKAEK